MDTDRTLLTSLAGAGFLSPCLSAAATLGLADLLHEGPLSAEALAGRTDTRAPILARLLRALVAAGVFQETAGVFSNNAASEVLRTDHPGSLRHFCILAGDEYQRAFGDVLHTLRTGEPAFRAAFGGSIYDHVDREPERGAVYDRAMEELARPVVAALAEEASLAGSELVVDVGGGRGTLLTALLEAHPGVRGLCCDRAAVCERAAADLRRSPPPHGDRLAFAAGDFFESVPAGGDVYVLKNVLHNWNRPSCLRILEVVRGAATRERDRRPPARLWIVEPLVEPGAPTPYVAMDDLFQAVVCEEGTGARSEEELHALLAEASFEATASARLAGSHHLLEAVVASGGRPASTSTSPPAARRPWSSPSGSSSG